MTLLSRSDTDEAMTLLSLGDTDGVGDLSAEAFEQMRVLVQRECGVAFGSDKRGLLRRRLRDRVRTLGLPDFDAYADRLERGDPDRREWRAFLDRVTTNRTRFFRERAAIDHVSEAYLDRITSREPPRLIHGWCAACSSGQEPASIVMAVLERLAGKAGWDIHLEATEVSERMLAKAEAGLYSTHEARRLSEEQRARWTVPAPGGARLSDEVRSRIRYSRQDLLDEVFPGEPGLDFIFCRNVMMYFGAEARTEVVRRLAGRLRPGGLLALGKVEILADAVPGLESVSDALYRSVRE